MREVMKLKLGKYKYENENVYISILFFLLKSMINILKSEEKNISHFIFKKWFDHGIVRFLAELFSERA